MTFWNDNMSLVLYKSDHRIANLKTANPACNLHSKTTSPGIVIKPIFVHYRKLKQFAKPDTKHWCSGKQLRL
jgi:hypothetical protein